MKVPTYRRQAENVSGAITPRVSAQVSPKAMGAQAEMLSEIGEILFNAGTEKLRVHAETQALKANKAMEVELRAIVDDARTQDITVYTPAEVQKKMSDVYEKYSSGKAVDPLTQKVYLGTSNARQAFQVQGYDSYQKYLSQYRKTSNKMIAKQAEINIVSRVSDEIKIAADTSLDVMNADGSRDQTTRKVALDNLLSTKEEIDDTSLGIRRRRGLLVYSATSGVMTAEQTTSLIEKTLEDIALGTAMSYMGDDSYAEVASDFVDGGLEARDAVLKEVLAELNPDQREALNRKVIDYANKNITRLENEEKDRNAEEKARLDALQKELVNIADSDKPKAMELFAELKRNNYYDTTSLKGTKGLLGLNDEDGSPEDDPVVVKRMYDLMNQRRLTIDEVFRHVDGLPKSSKKFYDMAVSLQDEAVSEGEELISTGIGYDKYKNIPGISKEADVFYQKAMNEFTAWRVTDPIPGQPLTGGRGAGYDTVIDYARKLSEKYSVSLKASIQSVFDNNYEFIAKQISESRFGTFQIPPDGNRKQAIKSWFESLTDQERQRLEVISVYNQFKRFENEDVR